MRYYDNPCKCDHRHVKRQFAYNTDDRGRVTTPVICGYYINKETICFCEAYS